MKNIFIIPASFFVYLLISACEPIGKVEIEIPHNNDSGVPSTLTELRIVLDTNIRTVDHNVLRRVNSIKLTLRNDSSELKEFISYRAYDTLILPLAGIENNYLTTKFYYRYVLYAECESMSSSGMLVTSIQADANTKLAKVITHDSIIALDENGISIGHFVYCHSEPPYTIMRLIYTNMAFFITGIIRNSCQQRDYNYYYCGFCKGWNKWYEKDDGANATKYFTVNKIDTVTNDNVILSTMRWHFYPNG
jgi:hypothetical protein